VCASYSKEEMVVRCRCEEQLTVSFLLPSFRSFLICSPLCSSPHWARGAACTGLCWNSGSFPRRPGVSREQQVVSATWVMVGQGTVGLGRGNG
jgi:hypothetical protein